MSSRRGAGASALPVEEVADRVAAGVRARLLRRLEGYERLGRGRLEADDIGDLVERMVAVVPRPSDWNQLIGPFYRTGQVAALLGGVSRQALDDRRARGTILALRTADDEWVYPTFQFEGRRIIRGLPEALSMFDRAHVDGWTLASWLRTRRPELEGRSIVAWLRSGRPVDPVLVLARDAARRFAQ